MPPILHVTYLHLKKERKNIVYLKIQLSFDLEQDKFIILSFCRLEVQHG